MHVRTCEMVRKNKGVPKYLQLMDLKLKKEGYSNYNSNMLYLTQKDKYVDMTYHFSQVKQ